MSPLPTTKCGHRADMLQINHTVFYQWIVSCGECGKTLSTGDEPSYNAAKDHVEGWRARGARG